MALNSLRACTGLTCFLWDDLLTLLVWPSSCFSLFTRGFFSGAFILQEMAGMLRASIPLFFWYLVDATYEALTVDTTAFIRFLAAWMRDMALSNYRGKRRKKTKEISILCSPSHPCLHPSRGQGHRFSLFCSQQGSFRGQAKI